MYFVPVNFYTSSAPHKEIRPDYKYVAPLLNVNPCFHILQETHAYYGDSTYFLIFLFITAFLTMDYANEIDIVRTCLPGKKQNKKNGISAVCALEEKSVPDE